MIKESILLPMDPYMILGLNTVERREDNQGLGKNMGDFVRVAKTLVCSPETFDKMRFR